MMPLPCEDAGLPSRWGEWLEHVLEVRAAKIQGGKKRGCPLAAAAAAAAAEHAAAEALLPVFPKLNGS